MAIKGKNKNKGRPRGAKRPVGAPRPAAVRSHHEPWYRTMRGQLTAIVVVLAIIGLAMWRVSAMQSENKEREARQEQLADYTREVTSFVDQIQQPVREMLGAPFNTANPEGVAALEDSAERWSEELEKAGALVQAVVAPEDLLSVNVVLQQAFLMYGTAAKTYALAPEQETNKLTQDVLERAREMRDQAGRVLGGAIGQLDALRASAEMRPSGIQLPGTMTPILPTPSPTPTDEATEGGDNKKKGDG